MGYPSGGAECRCGAITGDFLMFALKHQIFDLLRIFGLRDRLRCPECRSVGTWKPHGGWCDESRASGRRWICKWCGLYVGAPWGRVLHRRAFVDPALGCWRIEDFYSDKIPKEKYIPKEQIEANPWNG